MNHSLHTIPIEDDPCDVIGKAMRGLGMSRDTLAEKTNLTENTITRILAGETDTEALGKIALALNLSAKALSGLPSYRPDIAAPPDLEMIVSPFGHAGVNSFIISHGPEAVVFDTGTDASPILDFLTQKNLNASALVITHRHPDHTAGVADFGNTPVIFPEEMEHGQTATYGGISITALDASGHVSPARAYFSQDLSQPVCILGDCLFAGSMGGTSSPQNYQLALKTIRKSILPLPDNTILGPGHGPLTSLAMEKLHNPFLAD